MFHIIGILKDYWFSDLMIFRESICGINLWNHCKNDVNYYLICKLSLLCLCMDRDVDWMNWISVHVVSSTNYISTYYWSVSRTLCHVEWVWAHIKDDMNHMKVCRDRRLLLPISVCFPSHVMGDVAGFVITFSFTFVVFISLVCLLPYKYNTFLFVPSFVPLRVYRSGFLLSLFLTFVVSLVCWQLLPIKLSIRWWWNHDIVVTV